MPAVRIRESVAPTYLSNFRILQIILAVIYLILICYTGVHHGYWNSLAQPLGFGSTCAFTSHAFDDRVLFRTFPPIPPHMSMFISIKPTFPSLAVCSSFTDHSHSWPLPFHLQARTPYLCPLRRWSDCSASADGIAVSTALATILVSIASILKQNITTRTVVRGHLIHFLRIVSEFIMMALWIASFITMLLPKGKDYRDLFDKPPHIVWDIAIAITILEASVSFYIHLTRRRGRS